MPSDFKYYNHLGFNNPYYVEVKDGIHISNSFKNAIESRLFPNPELDEVAIVQYACRSNLLSNRTIVKNLNKSPWMARLDISEKHWNYYDVPKHEELKMNPRRIAKRFSELLTEELRDYIKASETIGVLLTGGMDSRVVSSLLYDLMKEIDEGHKRVVALTWGNENSRDIIYSRKIAERFNWEWRHYPLDVMDLDANIEEAAIRGSEYSPIHLHSMLRVREETGIDCLIGGSFGDSIGRGEYAGRHVSELRDIRSTITNRNGFVQNQLFENVQSTINEDIESYWKLFPLEIKYQQFEQDYQIHYMRRKLNPCLDVINEKIPVYQAYSSPKVFGFMWSLHPECRGNEIYKSILEKCSVDLSDIPWSRTGLVYDQTSGIPDRYLKDYHSYSKWIRHDLYDKIRHLALSETIRSLGVFNMKALESYLDLMKTPFYSTNIRNEEKIIWIASLCRAIEIYKIESDSSGEYREDSWSWYRPIRENIKDNLKDTLVKLRK